MPSDLRLNPAIGFVILVVAYMYLGSVPFFVALYRAFRLFGHLGKTGAPSQSTVDALRVIRQCALAMIGFVALGVVFILMFGNGEDRPAGIFMSFLVASAAGTVAVVAAKFARKLQFEGRRG